ncbi:hypothetical protein HOY80DRAFT_982189 [Tuber brumale]|nr:hypothetical protein HOY80DRAFT_982189 [Tuber brumale]
MNLRYHCTVLVLVYLYREHSTTTCMPGVRIHASTAQKLQPDTFLAEGKGENKAKSTSQKGKNQSKDSSRHNSTF